MDTIIVADIGGTNARFALASPRASGGFELTAACSYPTADFVSFDACLGGWLETVGGARGQDATIAAAGPAVGNTLSMTNLGWRIEGDLLGDRLGLGRVRVINDFVAMAWATDAAEDLDLVTVKGGQARPEAPRLVIGPGTGLGVAALLPVDGRWVAMPGEGGHIACAPYRAFPEGVFGALATAHPEPWLELALSGRGLENLYRATCFAADERAHALSARDVCLAAVDGTDPRCVTAARTFCRVLAEAARDFTLTFSALGGVFLAGGILPRIESVLLASDFENYFATHANYSGLLAPVPVHLIRHGQAAMLGAASWYAARAATHG